MNIRINHDQILFSEATVAIKILLLLLLLLLSGFSRVRLCVTP